jgi:anti-anti-sigma factor
MDYRYSSDKGLARIALAGRIEAQDTAKLKEPFAQAESTGFRLVELDFGGVAYIGSAGIATLLQMHKLLNSRGGSLRIVNARANIASMFQSLKLDRLFQMPARG